MVDFYSVFYQLESSGLYEYVLPFLLVFVIVFAILEKTRILGEIKKTKKEFGTPKTNLNIIFAIIFSFMLLTNTDLILIMNLYISRMSFFIVIALVFMLVVALFHKPSGDGKMFSGWSVTVATILAVAAVIWSLYSSTYGGLFPYGIYLSDSTLSLIFFIIIIVLVIAMVKPKSSP